MASARLATSSAVAGPSACTEANVTPRGGVGIVARYPTPCLPPRSLR